MDYWPGLDWVRRYNRGFHEAFEDVVLQGLIWWQVSNCGASWRGQIRNGGSDKHAQV